MRELGPLLRRTSNVVSVLSVPHQVYVCLWSHHEGVPVHIHFVVQPVTKEQRDGLGGGPYLQAAMFDADEMPDAVAVEKYAHRARRAFAV